MYKIVVSSLIFASLIAYAYGFPVIFTHHPWTNTSTIQMQCSALLNPKKGEYFQNLTVAKDGQVFYSTDYKRNTRIKYIPGITRIIPQNPGQFVITQITKQTSGWYNCTVITTIKRFNSTGFKIKVKSSANQFKHMYMISNSANYLGSFSCVLAIFVLTLHFIANLIK